MMLLPMIASADAVEIDGIYYNLITKAKTAEVTSNPNKYAGDIVIPENVTYNGIDYSVNTIDLGAFQSCNDLLSVTIPNSVTSIGENAFLECKNMNSVNIPDKVTEIKGGTFKNCTKLLTITIPSSVEQIGYNAFEGCWALTSVHISDIASWCKIFYGEYAMLSSNPLYYAHHLYLNDEEIIDFEIPEGVTSIGDYAFTECYSLKSVTISNSVTSIGKSAFQGCINMESMSIPNTVTFIGEGAFAGCSRLTSFSIPNSVKTIEYGTFQGCKGLTTINIPDNIVMIGGASFDNCTGLTAITIPNSVTEIGNFAFSYCSSVKFISIGNSVNRIGSEAFANCDELLDVYCLAKEVPKLYYYGTPVTDIFENSYIEYATLHVPEESISSYEASSPWNQFQSIVPLPKYKLTYMLDDVVYKVEEYEEGTSITPEPNPTKEGYTFSGWSEIPETMPAHDVIVTGSFSINSYKLTYLVDDVEYKSYEIEYGTAIIPETEPTKDGYSFSGWSEIPETMPAHDVTVTGTFTPVEDMLDGHEYVDLGLPSGKCWATTNYGSDTPEGYGTYLEWGDNSIVSSSWGTDWMTPSFEDIRELQNNCSWIWDSKNGHNGYTVKGANGNSIFLPASGYKMVGQSSAKKIGEWVYYWTSTQSGEMAKIIMCTSIEVGYGEMNASLTKLPIRPITKKMSSDIKGVTSSMADELQDIVGVYDMQGHKLNSMVKGINIVKFRNGSLKKVIK